MARSGRRARFRRDPGPHGIFEVIAAGQNLLGGGTDQEPQERLGGPAVGAGGQHGGAGDVLDRADIVVGKW